MGVVPGLEHDGDVGNRVRALRAPHSDGVSELMLLAGPGEVRRVRGALGQVPLHVLMDPVILGHGQHFSRGTNSDLAGTRAPTPGSGPGPGALALSQHLKHGMSRDQRVLSRNPVGHPKNTEMRRRELLRAAAGRPATPAHVARPGPLHVVAAVVTERRVTLLRPGQRLRPTAPHCHRRPPCRPRPIPARGRSAAAQPVVDQARPTASPSPRRRAASAACAPGSRGSRARSARSVGR